MKNLHDRDIKDSSRKDSPLTHAEGAILIDTSCTSVCTVTITITDDEGVIFDTVMVDVEG